MSTSVAMVDTPESVSVEPTGDVRGDIFLLSPKSRHQKRLDGIKIPPCLSWIPDTNIGDGIIESNYQMSKRIGCGGSSSVVRAVDIHHGGVVAVKKMSRKEVTPEMFDNEATMLFNIHHKGTVKFVNAAMDSKNYYLILEYAKGGDLVKLTHACGGRLDEKLAATVIRRILRTLAWLHDKDLVHRDLKPENIVFRCKSSWKPILIDFAMALKVPKDQSKQIRDCCGTPYYAAPEKWGAHPAASLKSGDMWAIGVIAFAIVTGFLPFHGRSLRETSKRICEVNYKFYDKEQPTSKEFKSFIRGLLTKDYTKRLTAKQALKHPWLMHH